MDRYVIKKNNNNYLVEKNLEQYAQFSSKKNVEHFLTLLVNSTIAGSPAIYIQDNVEASKETVVFQKATKTVALIQQE